MRIWNIPPHLLCRKHLMGEHLELHMIISSLDNHKSLNGFFLNGLIQLDIIYNRHEELTIEIQGRGYKHNSIMDHSKASMIINSYLVSLSANKFKLAREAKVNGLQNIFILFHRCKDCRDRINNFMVY